jgi:hypothetical protein
LDLRGPFFRAARSGKSRAQQLKFFERNQARLPFKRLPQKYSSFFFSETNDTFLHPASIAEGRIAIVTTCEAGKRWTRGC